MALLGDALGTGGPSSLHAPQLNTRTAGKHSGRKRFTLLHRSSSTPSTLLTQYVLSKRWIFGSQTRTHQREPKTNHNAVTVISIAVTVTTIVPSQPPPLKLCGFHQMSHFRDVPLDLADRCMTPAVPSVSPEYRDVCGVSLKETCN